MNTLRIVSLIASATEIVCALGFRNRLVGRSHECDYPQSVKELPKCTAPKFKTDGMSYQIDERVKAIVQEGLSVYRVDAAIIEHLQPTHIITQDQCQVCAVSLEEVENACCQLTGISPKVVSLNPNSLSDIWEDLRAVGRALGAQEKAEALVARLRTRMEEIAERSAPIKTSPTVATIEWIDPLMSGGNWMPELVAMAGGVSLFGQAGRHSPYLSWDELKRRDPEVIVVAPCGFDLEKTLSEMRFLTERPGWKSLSAVLTGRVFVCDGNQFFNRPGPRIVESLEILAEIIHPARFQFGHLGRAFLSLQPAGAG